MPLALILSSFVAASRIGGAAQQYVLAAHKIDPVLAPTVLFGRSPARGGTGEATKADVFQRMLGDIEADAIFGLVDLVITGHFSLPDQVEIAADVLERVREAPRGEAMTKRPVVVVDPIMGDWPKGLYVAPAVADRVAERLAPLGDYITPNLWELGRLSGKDLHTADDAVAAARAFGRPALITSAPAGEGEIGLIYADADQAVLFAHRKADAVPNGTGDLVTASFGAALVDGQPPVAAAQHAARAAAEAVKAAKDWRATELPVVALATRLVRPSAEVRIERL